MMKKGDRVIYDPPYTPSVSWEKRRGEVFTFLNYRGGGLYRVADIRGLTYRLNAEAFKLEKTGLLESINIPMDWEV